MLYMMINRWFKQLRLCAIYKRDLVLQSSIFMLRDWSTLYHFCLQATISSCTMVQNHLINSLWLSLYFKESISTNGLIDINRLLLSSTCLLLPSIRPPSKSKSVDWMTKLLSQIPWINHFCENAKTNNGIQSTRTESNDNNNFFNWKKWKILHFFMEARAVTGSHLENL